MPTRLILFLLIMTPTAANAAQGISLYEELRRSIVTVQGMTPVPPSEGKSGVFNTWGAGVILDKSGIIATNTHIIHGAQHIRITLASGEQLNAKILYIAPHDDVSLLKVIAPHPLLAVDWADSNLVRLNDEIITIGHSELLKNTISGGHIRSIGIRHNDPDKTPEFLELDINHYPGDSGGPVFDRQGRFLGLMSAKRMHENRACFVIPSNKVRFAYINVAKEAQNR